MLHQRVCCRRDIIKIKRETLFLSLARTLWRDDCSFLLNSFANFQTWLYRDCFLFHRDRQNYGTLAIYFNFLSVLYATKSSEKVEELSKPTWSTKTSVLTWSLSKNFFPLRSQICFFLEYLTKTGWNYCSLLMLASEKFVRSSVTDFLVTATSHSHKIITGCLIYLSMNFV